MRNIELIMIHFRPLRMPRPRLANDDCDRPQSDCTDILMPALSLLYVSAVQHSQRVQGRVRWGCSRFIINAVHDLSLLPEPPPRTTTSVTAQDLVHQLAVVSGGERTKKAWFDFRKRNTAHALSSHLQWSRELHRR